MLRYLLLSLLAFISAFAAKPAPPPDEVLAWGKAAQQAALSFLPVVVALELVESISREKVRQVLKKRAPASPQERVEHSA